MLQSSHIKDLKMFINEESWIEKVILLCKQKQIIANTWLISKVLAKRVQRKISGYFIKLKGQ